MERSRLSTRTDEAHVASPGIVRQVLPPADARALSTLSRIDYADAFYVDTSGDLGRTGEQWARATLDDAPLSVRSRLVLSWTALGLRLGPPCSSHRVLGWQIRRNNREFVLLGANSWVGLRGELLFRSEPHGLLFATFLEHSNPAARVAWKQITPKHQRVVHSLLAHAARRAEGR
jgi:hypothetical protein